MKVIEKEAGRKVEYEELDTKLFFNDELMLNLAKYERDFEQTLDICADENNCLAMGLAQRYVAQVVIPARKYELPEVEMAEGEIQDTAQPQALPLNMEDVTLILWNVEGYIDEQ